MILGPDGAKLSKRHGAVSVLQYRDEGFLPEGLLNYLGRLGWSSGDQEIFTLEEMVALFDIHDVNKSASALNPDKMLWTNQQHMLRATPERLAQYLKPQFEALGIVADDMVKLAAVAKAQQERAKTLTEMAHNSRFFFVEVTDYEPKAAAKNLTRETAPLLQAAYEALATLAAWCAPAIHESITGVAARHDVGLGRVAQPIRVAVSGGTVSPPIDVTLEILGRDVTLARLRRAIAASMT
jgi:glutamyl-tRNA synthetase